MIPEAQPAIEARSQVDIAANPWPELWQKRPRPPKLPDIIVVV
jgi:hypothetical protein